MADKFSLYSDQKTEWKIIAIIKKENVESWLNIMGIFFLVWVNKKIPIPKEKQRALAGEPPTKKDKSVNKIAKINGLILR